MTHDENIVEAVALVLEPKCRGFCGGSNGLSMGCAREFARAAITAFQAEAWQDISTAPKGQVILGYQATPGDWQGRMAVCWDFAPDGRSLFIGDGGLMPTHWQPLPNPPASP